jgi:hypothetical protein
MKEIPYPVQIIDAIRDVALNVLWHIVPTDKPTSVPLVEWIMRDDSDFAVFADLAATKVTDEKAAKLRAIPSITKVFKTVEVNPVAWASRYTRKFAIENATKSVYLTYVLQFYSPCLSLTSIF